MSSTLKSLATPIGAVLCAAAVLWQAAPTMAQSAPRLPRICFLTVDPVATGNNRYTPFFDRLRELGFVDGQTISLDWLSAGDDSAFDRPAAECVRRGANVIVTGSTPATQAAKRATTTIPIVMLVLGDPVGTGLVASLAKPGGNVTGTTNLAPQMMVKGLELLHDTVPRLARVLVITYPRDPISRGQVAALEQASKPLGIELLVRGIDGAQDLAAAFAAGEQAHVQGVIVTVESIFSVHRQALVDLVHQHRLPAVFSQNLFVRAGGLMSYDANREVLAARTADYVDKVLKGMSPGDLPIEQPSVFNIAINKRTARELGITFTPSLLALADEVIE